MLKNLLKRGLLVAALLTTWVAPAFAQADTVFVRDLGRTAGSTAGVPFDQTLGINVNQARLDAANDEVATGATAAQTGAYGSRSGLSVNTGFDATVVKASAGRLYGYVVTNTDATKLAFVKFYDKATAPDPSADGALLKWTAFIPPSTATLSGQTVAVVTLTLPHGIAFANGIGFVITQLPGTDETAVDANDVAYNIVYKN